MKLAAEHRVDHHVEDQVVQRRDPAKQPRVPEDHVMQFVHHQQEQVALRLAVLVEKVRIEQQSRCRAALHGCGRH